MDDAAPLAPPVLTGTGAAYRWILRGEVDPQLPARVLACFAVRNELPSLFCMRQVSAECVRIELRARCDNDDCARRLSLRLRAIPTVIEVAESRV